jgi:hypothetical protein
MYIQVVFAKYIPITQTVGTSGYHFNFTTSYFQSTSLLNIDGSPSSFENEESYQSANMSAYLSYGLTKQMEVFASANGRYNRSTVYQNSSAQSFTKIGLESSSAGFRLASKREHFIQYILEGEYKKRFFTNANYDPLDPVEEIVLGDDGDGYRLSVGLSYMTDSDNYFDFMANYRKEARNLSNEVLFDTKFVFAWKKFALLFGMEYLFSLNQDAYTNDPANKPNISSGSTNLYNSINRSYTHPYLGMNFGMGKTWHMQTRVGSTIAGQSTDAGIRGIISLVKWMSVNKEFAGKNNFFKQYEIEGVVSKISKSNNVAIIDKGIKDGLGKGKRVDFYFFDFVGGEELIAEGIVIKSSYEKSMVKVIKKYSKRRIKDGTTIRSGLIRE